MVVIGILPIKQVIINASNVTRKERIGKDVAFHLRNIGADGGHVGKVDSLVLSSRLCERLNNERMMRKCECWRIQRQAFESHHKSYLVRTTKESSSNLPPSPKKGQDNNAKDTERGPSVQGSQLLLILCHPLASLWLKLGQGRKGTSRCAQ